MDHIKGKDLDGPDFDVPEPSRTGSDPEKPARRISALSRGGNFAHSRCACRPAP
jgi:hypothetical protein